MLLIHHNIHYKSIQVFHRYFWIINYTRKINLITNNFMIPWTLINFTQFHEIYNLSKILQFHPFRPNHSDVNLVITWSRNPHTKTPILEKPSKLGLIGVWHKDNLYLGTSTIGNGDPHPTNIDSRMRSIRMTPRRQLFFDKSFSVL